MDHILWLIMRFVDGRERARNMGERDGRRRWRGRGKRWAWGGCWLLVDLLGLLDGELREFWLKFWIQAREGRQEEKTRRSAEPRPS